MRRKYFLIATFLVALGIFFSVNIIAKKKANFSEDPFQTTDINVLFANTDGSESKNEAILATINHVLRNGHYAPKSMDKEFSQTLFKEYLSRLDYGKTFFLQSDIDQFKKYENDLGNQVENHSLLFYNDVQKIWNVRIQDSKKMFEKALNNSFDFTLNEEIQLDGDKLDWCANNSELQNRWNKNIRYRVLSKFYDAKTTQDEQIKEKKISEKDIKKDDDLKKEAVESVKKTMDFMFRRYGKLTEVTKLDIYYNAITSLFDPHSAYFSPKQKERFDEGMRGSFFGIGAVLQMKDEICTISQIMPGMPAEREGHLKVGDGILKVGQGNDTPVDVVGWDLQDIVDIIRGKKGTTVKLTVEHLDKTKEIIAIKRDEVEIEATFAKSIILKSGGNKIGFIHLPEFYADFNNFNGRRCATDIKAELAKLKKANVDGVILDLRNNGGGSLSDVIDIAGYFIEDGPVVQVKSQNSRPQAMNDKDPDVFYNGPLAVLINGNSASASEIFAAAIQDYNRGIIIGTRSFGKGTVQRVYDLDQFFRGDEAEKPLGNIKLTVQKFYRVSGASTQLKGVLPDILIPNSFELLDLGERDEEFAMPWDQIGSADYKPYSIDLGSLKTRSQYRIQNNREFNLVKENARRIKEQKDNNVYSLNYTSYSEKMKENKDFADRFKEFDEAKYPVKFENLPSTLQEIKSDTLKEKNNTQWIETLEKDAEVNEAVHVLNDWISTLPREITRR